LKKDRSQAGTASDAVHSQPLQAHVSDQFGAYSGYTTDIRAWQQN